MVLYVSLLIIVDLIFFIFNDFNNVDFKILWFIIIVFVNFVIYLEIVDFFDLGKFDICRKNKLKFFFKLYLFFFIINYKFNNYYIYFFYIKI